MKQPEALRLADALDGAAQEHSLRPFTLSKAATELRRLHEAHDWQYKMAGERLRRIEKLERMNQELLEALKEAEYALDYASDMTKPEGLSGCDCPICSVSVKVRAAIAKAQEPMK